MIKTSPTKLHWNYFLAIERDLERISRYIEFDKRNFKTYSVELARILLASSSEVDVIAKRICALLGSPQNRSLIDNYRSIIVPAIPDLSKQRVYANRHGLNFQPWILWKRDKNPTWWKGYNNVKHERDAHFSQATLHNALHSVGALLILTFYYYKLDMESGGDSVRAKDVTFELVPKSSLLELDPTYYYDNLVV